MVEAEEIPIQRPWKQEHFDMMEQNQDDHCGWSAVRKGKGVRRQCLRGSCVSDHT